MVIVAPLKLLIWYFDVCFITGTSKPEICVNIAPVVGYGLMILKQKDQQQYNDDYSSHREINAIANFSQFLFD